MHRIFSFLKKRGEVRPKTSEGFKLSADFLDLSPEKKALDLKSYVRSLLEKIPDWNQFSEQFYPLASAVGWSSDEIEKTIIYAAYFSGNVIEAHRRIVEGGYEKKDVEMFVVACMALYADDRFEDAYRLLSGRNLESIEFVAQSDFLSFAGYIVLAAGKSMSEAIRFFDVAFQAGINSSALATNAYAVYFEAGNLEMVSRIRKIIHEEYNNDPQALFSVGCGELAKGYYPEGFRLAESRYDHPDAAKYMRADLLKLSRWQRASGVVNHLLIHAEQGLGDIVMCARFFPMLSELANKVTIECHSAAVSLFKENFPSLNFVSIASKDATKEEFDCWVGAMSLPWIFNCTASSIPQTTGYLSVPSDSRIYWQGRVSSGGVSPEKLKVGVAWSGSPSHRSDRRRSVFLGVMGPYISSCEGVEFFSLQTSVPENVPDNLINFSDELVTLSDTLALIDQMDLVITVDTSIVHLAGALGKKTFLLLPFRYEWRWGLAGESNAWYDSVAVIRQPSHGDWKSVLDEVFCKRVPSYIEKMKARNA